MTNNSPSIDHTPLTSKEVEGTVPKEKREFYYWLCENISIKSANLWLDGKYGGFISLIQSYD
jgi:hypothetical protein